MVDQYQRRELTDGELEALQHPLTYEEIFPADIAKALKLLMEPYPSDPYVAALIFMAGMSGVLPLGTGVNHRTKIFPANMYVAGVAATGTTKSSQLDELVDFPLRLVRAKVANENAQELEDYLALPKSKRPSKPPTPLLCDTGDATPEALIAHLVRQYKNKKALLVFKDEASEHFLGMALEMKNGRGSSLGLFLECFDGKGRTKTTRGDGVLSFPASKLSFVGCIQPQVLSDLMHGTDYAGQWSRILFPAMPTRLLQLQDSDPTEDEQKRFRAARVTLENMAMELYKMEPHVCHLTAEARAHVNAWFRHYQRKAIDPTTPQILQSMFNKGMAHAMRAAIILHKIHVKGEASKVPMELMQISTRLVDAAFTDTIRLHRGNAGASKLFQHIQTTTLKAKRHMTWQEIKGKGDDDIRKIPAADFDALVPVMVEMGIGEQGKRKRSITYMGTQELVD
ncbi:hypothetical protein SynRS9907_01456 [Synechococcus sp. RS9907]|nr:hypothetical protein SynRS9907_01456 [Synechococcus sp. RS9907]